MSRFTEEQYAQLLRENERIRPTTKTPSREVYEAMTRATRPRKYRNEKTDVGGVVFDSAKEAKRWQELQLLVAGHEITQLRRQVAYALHVNGQLIGRFTPDFAYLDHGRQVCEDVKSPITRQETAYRLRVKLFSALYPEIDFREV